MSPCGVRRAGKKEEGRTKNENRLLTWSVGAGSFLFSFFYFRFSIFVFSLGFRPPGEKERKKKNEE
jgi:hypothetical protein